jgi:Ca2+-binding EF-hand superfamily protein
MPPKLKSQKSTFVKSSFRRSMSELKPDDLGVSAEQFASFKKQFELLDKDKSGEITVDEVKRVVKNFGYNSDDGAVLDIINLGDQDGNRSISFEEFVRVEHLNSKHSFCVFIYHILNLTLFSVFSTLFC